MMQRNEHGPLYTPDQAERLERVDRDNPIPGSEPECPVCDARTVRIVEAHPAPRSDDSPFRVRLICGNDDCRRWTVYNW